MRLFAVLLALVASLVAAGTACAQSRIVRTGALSFGTVSPDPRLYGALPPPISGPALAGDSVVWSERAGPRLDRIDVVADGPAGRRVIGTDSAQAYQGQRLLALDAAPDGVAFTSFEVSCGPVDDVDDPCSRYSGEYPQRGRLLRGPLGGPLVSSDACPAGAVSVAEGALALGCVFGSVVVREPDGAERTIPDSAAPDLSGAFLARTVRDGFAVERRRDGALVQRRDGPVDDVAAADDGSAAFVVHGGAAVGFAPADGSAPRTVGVRGAAEVRTGGDLLAVRSVSRGTSTFTVLRRDGSFVASLPSAAPTGAAWDFDGRRLAWLSQPCASVSIAVWELGTEPPAEATDCALPQPGTPSVELRRRLVRIPFTCPGYLRGECAGAVTLRFALRSRGRRSFAAPPSWSVVEPGRRSALIVRLGPEARRLRGLRRVAMTVAVAGTTGVVTSRYRVVAPVRSSSP